MSFLLILQRYGLLLSWKARIIVCRVYLLSIIRLLKDLSVLSHGVPLQSSELDVVLRLSTLNGHLILAYPMDERPHPVSVLVFIGSQQL